MGKCQTGIRVVDCNPVRPQCINALVNWKTRHIFGFIFNNLSLSINTVMSSNTVSYYGCGVLDNMDNYLLIVDDNDVKTNISLQLIGFEIKI